MKLLQLPFWDFFKSIDSYPEYFNKTNYWIYVFVSALIIIVALLILWLIYWLIYDAIDNKKSKKHILLGEIIDKRYIGEQSSSGTGTAILPTVGGGVGVGVVSTSSHSDEEFLFFVRTDKVYKIEVDMQQFYGKNIGDKVNFEVTTGGLSKEEIGVELA